MLKAEVTSVVLTDLDDGLAKIVVAFSVDTDPPFAIREFRLDVRQTWNAETRTSMIDRIKHTGMELYRNTTRFTTIQGNLVGQSITIIP